MIDAEQRGAWDVVVQKLQSFVARRVSASDVDDIVQDVLVRIHKNAGDVADERFGAWVYTVARNAITDHYRVRAAAVPPLPQLDDDVEEERVLLSAWRPSSRGCHRPIEKRSPSWSSKG